MFEEVSFRLDLGCRVLPGQFVVSRFGSDKFSSIVVVSQTLDKLIVCPLKSIINENCDTRPRPESTDGIKSSAHLDTHQDSESNYADSQQNDPFYHISVNDVISCVSAVTISSIINENSPPDVLANSAQAPGTRVSLPKSILIIGCTQSLLIYDAEKASDIQRVPLQKPINVLTPMIRPDYHSATIRPSDENAHVMYPVFICAGHKKLQAVKMILSHSRNHDMIEAEVSSERTTSDYITCAGRLEFDGCKFILTGSKERLICAYQFDETEQNIMPCQKTIEESSQVECICPIYTLVDSSASSLKNISNPDTQGECNSGDKNELANVRPTINQLKTKSSHFAYGLENGTIGVHSLYQKPKRESHDPSASSQEHLMQLSSERLWRHKCKGQTVGMLMYDINGDGLDELIVGFKNSRIEVRSPFTGQLLATTRCFRGEKLVGITVMDVADDIGPMLLLCSTGGSIIGFRPKSRRPHLPLQGFRFHATNSSVVDKPLGVINEVDPLDSLEDYGPNYVVDVKMIEKEVEQAASNDLMTGSHIIGSASWLAANTSISGVISAPIASSNLQIEARGDDSRVKECDSRQSHELLLRLKLLKADKVQLEKRALQIRENFGLYDHYHFSQNRHFEPQVNFAIRWDCDIEQRNLKLTIAIKTPIDVDIELVELEDEAKNLPSIADLAYIQPTYSESSAQNPVVDYGVESGQKVQVVMVPLATKKDIDCRLIVRVFCRVVTSRRTEGNVGSEQVRRIFEHPVEILKFTMLKIADQEKIRRNSIANQRIKLALRLHDESQVLQLIDWLDKNLLCFRYGALIDNTSEALEGERKQNVISSDLSRLIEDLGQDFEYNFESLRGPNDRIDGIEEMQNHDSLYISCRKHSSNRVLILKSHSIQLLESISQSLLIDRLQLQLTQVESTSTDWLDSDPLGGEQNVRVDAKPLVANLNQLIEKSRFQEESERRIQTELYESADQTKNLMNQLALAIELDEYSTCRDLLSELSITMNNVQDAAKAQKLNSDSRNETTSQVEELRQKMKLLTDGHD